MAVEGRVLIVDPERNRGQLLVRRLLREGVGAQAVSALDEALAIEPADAQVVLIDLALLCGPSHRRLSDILGHLARRAEYRCQLCGRRVSEVASGVGALMCCGRPMVGTPAPVSG